MESPQIDVTLSKPVACADAPVTLDVLVRITPPQPEIHFPRPALNLGLVLDRSGSMAAANKMPLVHQAAAFAIEQLLPTDRVSVTVYDEVIETIVPSTLATDKPEIIRKLNSVGPRGSTDLHGGWEAGAKQTSAHMVAGGLNRVLLMTDGLANHGTTDPNAIERDVKSFANRGVSTSTLGVGNDYNELLLERMARASDGNYYYVESPLQLADLFQTELQGLMATSGQKVSLGVEPAEGVTLVEVLNDFERVSTDRYKLANLIIGMPQSVVVRLSVAPGRSAGPICAIRLAWTDPKRPDRQVRRVTVDGRAPIALAEWNALPVDAKVTEQVALLMAARAQREAAHAYGIGDLATARRKMSRAMNWLQDAPETSSVILEREEIRGTMSAAAAGSPEIALKRAHYAAYRRQQSQPKPKPPEPEKSS